MQGVRLVNTPPAKTSGIASAGLPDRVSRSVEKSTIVLSSDSRHQSVVNQSWAVNGALGNASFRYGRWGSRRSRLVIVLENSMSRISSRTWLTPSLAMLAAALWFPVTACAQTQDHKAP